MAQFEVQIPNRRLDTLVESAEIGERDQISAIVPLGGVVAIDAGLSVGDDQDPPAA